MSILGNNINQCSYVTKQQLTTILDYLDVHKGMFSGKITPDFTKEMKNALWEDLTEKLNFEQKLGMESGRNGTLKLKSVAKWQRTWIDWKCTLKRKARDILAKRTHRTLNDIEIRALKMIDRLENTKLASDLQDDGIEMNINSDPKEDRLSSSKDDGLSLLIKNIKSIGGESFTTVEEIPASPELIRVKEEVGVDSETSDCPTLIIKDAPISMSKESRRDFIAIATRDNPRVVLTDIAISEPKFKSSNTVCSNSNVSPKETPNENSSGINFVPPLGLQKLGSVTPVITNDTLSYGMANISSGTSSVISAGTNGLISTGDSNTISIGMQPNVSGAINNIKPFAMNNPVVVGLNTSQPIILNATPPHIIVNPVASSSNSVVANNNAPTSVTIENSATQQNSDIKRLHVSKPTKKSEKTIWDVIHRRRALIAAKKMVQNAPASASKTPKINAKRRSETEERHSKQPAREEIPEIIIDKESPSTKHISEDTLGGLPLNLQNSILERLDTLNRNIETNTCALTILSKTIKDSSDSQMRVINNLSKVLTTVGNAFLASVDRLMRPPDEG